MSNADPTMIQPTARDLLESAICDLECLLAGRPSVFAQDALASVRVALDMLPVPVPEPSEGEVRCATCATAERKCSTCPDMPDGYYDTNWTPEEARAIEGETP